MKFVNFFIANVKNEPFLVKEIKIMTPDYWKQLFDIKKDCLYLRHCIAK